MKALFPAFFFIMIASVVAAVNPADMPVEKADGQVALVGGMTLDPTTGVSAQQTIVVAGGRISAVIPEGGEFNDHGSNVIDVTGKWIVPSFVDMHAHGWGDASPTGMAAPYGTLGTAKRYLFAGVTDYLDLFSAEDDVLALRDHQRHSDLGPAARLYASGPCFTATNGHCSEYGIPTRLIDNPEEARAEVLDVINRGKPDVIKVVYDHNYTRLPTIDLATLQAALQAANEMSVKTVVHIGTWQDAREAILAGASAITHTYFEELPDDLAMLMAERRTFYIPTLAVQSDLLNMVKQPSLLDRPLLARMVGSRREAYRDEQQFGEVAKIFLAMQRRGEGSYARSVAKAHAAGVPILVGTDSGNVGVFQGYSVHREIELLAAAGLSNSEALAAASTNAGEFFATDKSLRPGALADLLILNSSPQEAVSNTQDIFGVMLRGQLVDREALLARKK